MSQPKHSVIQNREPIGKPSNTDSQVLTPLLTIRETAEYLSVSRSWLYHEVELKRFRLGNTIRFRVDSLNSFLQKQEYSGAAI